MLSNDSEPLAEAARILEGTAYRPVRRLGTGGMGQVFEIEHEFLGRRFAMKLLHRQFASNPRFIDRMRLEAQAMGQFRHSAAVEVVEYWIAEGGRACIVMELLRGVTLAEELRRRVVLPWLEALHIGAQALSALRAAHALGIVHRDIKPENLFLHEGPRGPQLKILDFGLARLIRELAPPTLLGLEAPTRTGAVVGTPFYMSPEAAKGERVDARTDLYSLAIVLYVAIAGRSPFDRDIFSPLPLSHWIEGVPAALDAIILRGIAACLDDRYQSADAFAQALASFKLS
ncbi:MAG: serine/threonine-protein kinase [Myxococcota bacterium]